MKIDHTTPQDKLSAEEREILEYMLQNEQHTRTAPAKIPLCDKNQDASLSFGQQRSWLVHELNKAQASPYDTLTISLHAHGALNVDVLTRSLTEIVYRHEILRTTFVLKGDEPVQVINEVGPVLEQIDISELPENERETRLFELLQQAGDTLFDLAQGPLFRARLIRLGKADHVLVMMMHHIIFDGWSTGILTHELSVLYENFTAGRPSPLPKLPIQYRDFSVWQRHWLQGEELDRHLGYWKQQLAGLPQLELPTDYPRPALQTFNGATEALKLSKELSIALVELSKARGVTLFMTMLAALGILLYRYSRQDDIGIGTVIANRDREELQGLIGFFLNTLVMRLDVSGEPSFDELLERVKQTARQAYAHQHLPFEKLVEEMQLGRETNRTPLFQVTFTMLDDSESAPLKLEDIELNPISLKGHTTRFDIETYVTESSSGISLGFAYNTDLFAANTIQRMLKHYRALLEGLVSDTAKTVTRIPMLTQQEYKQVVETWNRTDQRVSDQLVHQQVAVQAQQLPEQAAVVAQDRVLSYQALNAAANRLANYLIARGIGAGTAVAILLQRSPELIIAQLAVVKAGAAYVPIDPEYPERRIAYILNDTGAPVLLTQSSLQSDLDGYSGELFNMDRQDELLAGQSTEATDVKISADDSAYIIYTSGSTGEPKGVEVSHKGLSNLVSWHQRAYQVTASDRATHLAGLGFDASVWELWPYITVGASLYLVPDEQRLAAGSLWAWMAERGISLSFLPTPLAEAALKTPLPDELALRVLLTGGDRLHGGLVERSLPFKLVNHYGPTENTVVATCAEVDALDENDPPIGRPIDNVQTYILDAAMQPVPVGVTGELYIGGRSLASGYVNQAELTAGKFVADPFSREAGTRLYRSGDLVRYREDGQIEFVGRVDHQVKIRGFRIEPGEIESVLKRQAGVESCVVIAREEESGENRLVAYLTPGAEQTLQIDDLRNALLDVLPGYMVPAAFIILEQFPLTPNGKINRAALPAPELSRHAEQVAVAPRSELEQQIADIWRDILKLENVGVRDNFFDLGGHSLLLFKTHTRLVEDLGLDVTMLDLFEYPTIEAMADHLGLGYQENSQLQKAAERVSQRRMSHEIEGEPVAIVGMAGRFPGANDIESLWNNLRDGVESIRFFSKQELIEAGVAPDLANNPDYIGAHGYLEDADKFDAGYFGYSAREAETIDPQQRLLLECASELLDFTGYDPERYHGLIGVYAGSSINSYLNNIQSNQASSGSAGALTTVLGSGQDFLTTRLSYKLNLRGPSINVQTACSTSLVAVHQACRSLLDYECDMAMAGGVSVTVPLKSGYLYMEEGIGSADGHCRAFDSGANGTVGGNGVALVMLKRLQDAIADGDHIHAVIKGTAINNDGSHKVGYTAPSVEGQSEAITLAQAAAQCPPDSIDYIEAHGTGTHMGDPIEVAALSRVFAARERQHGPCWISALKTNMGHLDAAAGVAGLIKAALSVEHGELVPSLNYNEPNPQIDFGSGLFEINTRLRAWKPAHGMPRRAGVSSFGLGGTNAHVVLEQAPATSPSDPSRPWQLLCLSAKNTNALEITAQNLSRHLSNHADLNLADVAYTLQLGRRQYSNRKVIVCNSVDDALATLDGSNQDRLFNGTACSGKASVVFMFTGQGAQYPNMGLGLYRTESVFREAVDDCCSKLRSNLGLDLRQLLYPDGEKLEVAADQLARTELTQPALFVTEYALAQLWLSLGIKPDAMIGHSIGEYVAATLAGVMPLDDALMLVAERGRLMGQLPAGSMTAVPMSVADIAPRLNDKISVASVNSPGLCVISGPEAEIIALEKQLDQDGFQPQRIKTSHAFHSPMMEPILGPFAQRVGEIALNPPKLPYISNVTGDWITSEQATDPGYYARHLRSTVQFSTGLETLLASADRVMLEVGPGHTLSGLCKRHPDRTVSHACIASLRHHNEHKTDEEVFFRSLGQCWLAGTEPDWSALNGRRRRCRVKLPAYPFERHRYWIEPGKLADLTVRPRGRDANTANWPYLPSWKRVAVGAPDEQKSTATWLCFTDRSGPSNAIVQKLCDKGANVINIEAGEQFAQTGPDHFIISPDEPKDFDRLFSELKSASLLPRYIAHMWSVSPGTTRTHDDLSPEQHASRGFYSLVNIAKALNNNGLTSPMGIAVIATDVCDVNGEEPIIPEKALTMGPVKVIGMEHPFIQLRAIDIGYHSDSDPDDRYSSIASDLCSGWNEQVIAYRGRYRWAPSFEHLPLDVSHQTTGGLKEKGVYLITGGLGGLGLEFASYIAHTVNASLVLVSRSGLPVRENWSGWLAKHDQDDITSSRIRRIQRIEALGATVMVCEADVTSAQQMSNAIRDAETVLGPLSGVLHAAGAEKVGAAVATLNQQDCEKQFAPRIQGLQVLEQVLAGKPLDFCVINSSLASVMGVLGSVSYTAAHIYMDAFVSRHNRLSDQPWTCINWDNWNINIHDPDQPAQAATGYYMLPAEATAILARILEARDYDQVIVSSGDVQSRIEQWSQPEELQQDQSEAADNTETRAYPRPALSTEYQAPANETERILAGIWSDILGIDRIGIHDNFFELGGDSVLNIQITARATQAGLKLTPKQVFENQTIAELAAVVGAEDTIEAEQDLVTGPVPLTPIQHWFFNRNLPNPGHFNLPMLFKVKPPLDRDILADAMKILLQHHDALRMHYQQKEDGWHQEITGDTESFTISGFDLAGLAIDQQNQEIEHQGKQLQQSLNITAGPLLKLAYFDLGRERSHRLLFVVHHLVIDVVSWRVIIEDLQTIYQALSRQQEPRLPMKTVSIRAWSEMLLEYAQTPDAEAEIEYWQALGGRPAARLPVDTQAGNNTVASIEMVHGSLSENETRVLVADVPAALNTTINDVLLLALTQAVSKWSQGESVYVDMEGHGREAILKGVDPSRTVGWFTSLYPVMISLPQQADIRQQLEDVARQYRAIPNHGIGFGVLRYLNRKRKIIEALENLPVPQISFLYMGQFDQPFSDEGMLTPAFESTGPVHDPEAERPYLLEVNSIIELEKFHIGWSFSRNYHHRASVEMLAGLFMQALQEIINQAGEHTAGNITDPRLAHDDISEDDLAEILRQQGM